MSNMWTYTTTTSTISNSGSTASTARLYTPTPNSGGELYITRIPDYSDQNQRRRQRYWLSVLANHQDPKDNDLLYLYGGQNNLLVPPLTAGRHEISLLIPDTGDPVDKGVFARIMPGEGYKELIAGIRNEVKIPDANDMIYAPRSYIHTSGIKKLLRFYMISTDRYFYHVTEPKLTVEMIFDVFDYTMADLTFISNFIRYQIRNEQFILSTMKDKVKNLVSDFILGAICITPIIVPGPESFDPAFDYYPPSWQLFEGEEQYAYHFQPSKKAYTNGWREGIFTPAGNLVPVSVFEMADRPVVYVTRRLKGMRKPELDRLIEWKL